MKKLLKQCVMPMTQAEETTGYGHVLRDIESALDILLALPELPVGAQFQMLQILDRLEEVLQVAPECFRGDHVSIWNRAMKVFFALEDVENMERCALIQARLQPDSAAAHLEVAKNCLALNEPGRAISILLAGLKREDSVREGELNRIMARLAFEGGARDWAIVFLDDAMISEPEHPDNYFLGVEFLEAIGEYEAAKRKREKALALSQERQSTQRLAGRDGK